MTTALQIIERACRMAGISASGETLSADIANDGLIYLNGVLDSLSNENLAIYSDVLDELPMTGATSYTYGTGGDLNEARPQSVNYVYYRMGTIDYPVDIVTSDQYNSIALKTLSTSIPTVVFIEPDYPLCTVKVWPQSSTGSLFFNAKKPLTTLTSLTTALSMPIGYERLLVLCLATEIMPEYGIQNQQVIAMMTKAKADLKRTNSRPSVLTVSLPFGASANGGGYISIMSDGLC